MCPNNVAVKWNSFGEIMRLTRETILTKLGENKERLRELGVRRIGLFGSWARNEADEDSDIDFVVEFEEGEKNFDNFIALAFFLEELLGRKVDLLTLEGISPYIRPFVEKEAIYERV